MARPERFERPTPWFVATCSIQLSYGRLRDFWAVSATAVFTQNVTGVATGAVLSGSDPHRSTASLLSRFTMPDAPPEDGVLTTETPEELAYANRPFRGWRLLGVIALVVVVLAVISALVDWWVIGPLEGRVF